MNVSAPIASGMSDRVEASSRIKPIPGHEKYVSVMIPPPMLAAAVDEAGHDGQQCVAGGVLVANDVFQQTLRAGCQDIVLTQCFEHAAVSSIVPRVVSVRIGRIMCQAMSPAHGPIGEYPVAEEGCRHTHKPKQADTAAVDGCHITREEEHDPQQQDEDARHQHMWLKTSFAWYGTWLPPQAAR